MECPSFQLELNNPHVWHTKQKIHFISEGCQNDFVSGNQSKVTFKFKYGLLLIFWADKFSGGNREV